MTRTAMLCAMFACGLSAAMLRAQAPQQPPPKMPAAPIPSPGMGTDGALVELKDAKGASVGTVQLTETPSGVLLHGTLNGLPPGPHAFHIHEAGRCDAPDFKTAGGHFNPGAQQHGFASPKGAHAGDLPNLFVPATGKIEFDAVAKGVTLGPGPHTLLGPGGTSLVIHATADDYKSDPAGNAGARIACGVVTASHVPARQ